MAGSLPPLAQPQDLATWLGMAVDEDLDRAYAVLDAASAMVRAEAATTWVGTDGELSDVPADVVTLVVRLAAQMWVNPTSAKRSTTGPFSTEHGDLLTDADRAALNRFRSTSGALFTIETTRGDPETDSAWLPVTGSDKPLPSGYPL